VTTPRDRSTGASPVAEMAELSSDVHHLEQDVREHRRMTAVRHAEERAWRERMTITHAQTTASVARVGDGLRRLELVQESQAGTLGNLVSHAAETRGMIKLVGAVAAGVPVLIEIFKHVWR
jgi:hypothetical protein